ncbi:MAG: 50S ribosomal protein L11 methyltransferase [Betaproteobacteria bacterium]|nr:50S ribosomal protein L11 methyltransferase [Betaproteobacteria bacterium]
MAYLALLFEADADGAERWSEALLEAGALAVDIADAVAGSPAESPLYGEPGAASQDGIGWKCNRVLALFSEGTPMSDLLERLGREHALPELGAVTMQTLDDQDWVRLTQSQFGPIHATGRLWVVPSWSEPVDPGAINIRLDPGLAFGTGSHATTRLCLAWLDAKLASGTALLDYGCGSGLLAIAGALLGARPVHGVDIDPQAIQAATNNAARNQVSASFFSPGDQPNIGYAVVVANILTNPLCAMAPLLSRQVAAGGSLVLSGILVGQADQVIAAYAPWIALSRWGEEDGWVALAGAKPLVTAG